jgi:hypothetical protein
MHTTLLLLQPALLLQLAAIPTAAGNDIIIHAVLAPISLLSVRIPYSACCHRLAFLRSLTIDPAVDASSTP